MKRSLLAFTAFASLALFLLGPSAQAVEIQIGTGTGRFSLPLGTLNHDSRTQSIYLASEIGMAGQILSLALNVTTIPGKAMNNFTIRLKHTSLSDFSTASWDTGWTVVYQNNEPQGVTGWRTFNFTTPLFYYNGIDNLMVDISFNNSSASPGGFCRSTDQGGFVYRIIYFRSNSANGDPLAWSGTNPAPFLNTYRPNLRIEINNFNDTDGDGLPNEWENQYSCLKANTVDNLDDYDTDGLNNEQEFSQDINPCQADTDGDGLSDGAEVNNYSTNPRLADTDGDGLSDGDEVNLYSTNPKEQDTDNDRLDDGVEINTYGTNPLLADTDGGGEVDGAEIARGANPLNPADDALMVTLGTGTGEWVQPLNTANVNSRTEILGLCSEIGVSGRITSLALDVTVPPGQVMNNFTIRLKPTSFVGLGTDTRWDGPASGWVTVYQANESISKIGWNVFPFSAPFDYTCNVLSNLLVDISFNNTFSSTAGKVRYTNMGMGKSLYYISGTGDPLTWSGNTPDPSNSFNRPNTRLWFLPAPDQDLDGLPDVWENNYSCMKPNTVDDALDYDADGLDNNEEQFNVTDPCVVDTDGDGLSDGNEVLVYQTNPRNPDTDGDGMPDAWEVTYTLNPLANDANGDADGDGLKNGLEYTYDTNPRNPDTDGDGMPDGWEVAQGFNPLVIDAGQDADSDGLINLYEYQRGTNPWNPDTDADGLSDPDEVNIYLTNPLQPDTDSDLLNDWYELNVAHTSPILADTDGDGMKDGTEVNYGSNPLDALVAPGIYKKGPELQLTWNDSVSSKPSLVWTGSEFGVSWYDGRDGNSEIYFARVSANGEQVGNDLRVTADSALSELPRLIWTGTEFGISWHDERDGNSEIYFARVSADGAKVGADLRVTANASFSAYPALVWTGSEFGVAWHDSRDGNLEIYFARVAATGAKLGSDVRLTANSSASEYTSLAWTGSQFGVSWHDYRIGLEEIYFVRASSTGAKLGSEIRLTNNYAISRNPCLIWTGSEFAVSWHDYQDGNYEIYFTRISTVGSNLGPNQRLTSYVQDSWYTSLAWTGSDFGVSWQDSRDGNNEIYFTWITSGGVEVRDDVRITENAASSIFSSLAWTGSEFGLSWEDDWDENSGIYFSRIWIDRDGDGLCVAEEAAAGTQANNWDTDGDGLSDGDEINIFHTNPLSADSDADGLSDGLEVNTYYTNPLAADTDLDGVSDAVEVGAGLDPLLWDTDGDALPDGYEVGHAGANPPLDALTLLDGAADFDGDGNSNANEYWNGTDPWATEPVGGAGCFYWGDAGMGDGIVSPTDAIELKKAISGGVGNYTGVIPNTGETHELDMDGYISPLDLIILQKMIQAAAIGPLGSRPNALVTTYAPGATVNVGYTTHVTVSVRNEAAKGTPGFGVIFEIVPASSTATATLLGGEGASAPGSRYDISGPITPGGLSRIVLRLDSVGTLTLRARVPLCGSPGVGRSSPEIILDPAAVILAQ